MIRSRKPVTGSVAGLLVLVLIAAVIAGFAAALGSPLVAAAVGAPLVFVALLALRLEVFIWVHFTVTTWLAGTLGYFLGVGQAQWMPIGMGLVLYVVLLLRLVLAPRDTVRGLPPIAAPLAAFALVALVSTAWAGAAPPQWLYGLRLYFAMASLWLVLAMLPVPERTFQQLWMAVLVVALVQVPVVLYQYLFVAGGRAVEGAAGVAWDSVVGTLGGKQEGSGHSPALGFFMVAALIVALTLWKYKLIGTFKLIAIGLAMFLVIFLAEIKFYVLLIPIAIATLFRTQLLSRIKLLVAGAAVMAVTLVGVPVMYGKLHYERSGSAPETIDEFYANRVFSKADAALGASATSGQMGRITQPVFWWQQHRLLEQPKEFLLGHGMGALTISRLYAGDVARRYLPISVSNTGTAHLLWEVGLVGLALLVSIIVWASLASFVLSGRAEIPHRDRVLLEASAVILLMLIPAMVYRDFIIKSPAIQFLFFLCVGQVCYWRARSSPATPLRRRDRVSARHAPAAAGVSSHRPAPPFSGGPAIPQPSLAARHRRWPLAGLAIKGR